MFTIGDYSRLAQIPSKTLRYYDEIGLFTPMAVDPATGYRYYTVEQLPRLYRILSLKELGLTLKQISDVLNENITPEQLRGMLLLKKVQLKETIEIEQGRLTYIENKIEQLEANNLWGQYDIILKNIPELQVALARDIVSEKSALKDTLMHLFSAVREFLAAKKIIPTGHGFTVYFDDEYRETQIGVGAAFPINAVVSGNTEVCVTTLPAATIASVIHKGALEKMENAYAALLAWIAGNGYQIIGPPREIALQYEPTAEHPENFITEIQFPVRKLNN